MLAQRAKMQLGRFVDMPSFQNNYFSATNTDK